MPTRPATNQCLNSLAVSVGLTMPGLAFAHGTGHLHFWGSHTADGQVGSMAMALLGLAAFAWWLWRSRG